MDTSHDIVTSTSTAEGSALCQFLVDTSDLLKTDVDPWPWAVLDTSSQQQTDPVPTSAPEVGETPPAHAKIISCSYEDKTDSVLKKFDTTIESDDEVDMAGIQTDEQTDMLHQLAPAHIFEDVGIDLSTWLTNDDKDSDRFLTGLIPSDHLTFNWVQDHNIFRGKRERFTGISGPTFPVTDDTTPLDMFLNFFDNELFDLIIKQTNKYATRRSDPHLSPSSKLNIFVNIDRGEMARYLAILILQGLLPNPVEKSYWRKNGYLTFKYFKNIMSYSRFVQLKRLLHFNDSTDFQTLSINEKKLMEIKPVIDILQKKFSSLYFPRQEIVIDESLLKRQGRLSFAQRIARKAAKVDIKSYELLESETGYLWNFIIYAGKRDEQSDNTDGLTDGLTEGLTNKRTDRPTATPPTNATSKIIHDLVKPLCHRGHTLVMDNFYNSPLLARYLKSQGIDCFGTLRVNRNFVPEAIKTIQKHELRQGELVQCYTEDLSVIVWCDTKLVCLLSTYHDGAVGVAEENAQFKPQVVLDYNRTMAGVDRKDQLLSTFHIERVRDIMWYKKTFRHLLNVTLTNAHIIFQTRHKRCSAQDFRRQVAEGLIEMSQPHTIERPVDTVDTIEITLAHKRKKIRPILKGNHFIGPGPCKLARCVWCKKSRTCYICKQCGVSLCLEMCFEKYHRALSKYHNSPTFLLLSILKRLSSHLSASDDSTLTDVRGFMGFHREF